MLLIYVPAVTPRTEYIFELIFKNELGVEYNVTSDKDFFKMHQHEKLNYSESRFSGEIFIKASSLLFEQSIKKKSIDVERKYETIVLFPNDASCDIGFDIFASVFYMVSRYEEYLPFTPDKHGRFKAKDSLAYQNNFLQYPVVNTWIKYFKQILIRKFPAIQFTIQHFKSIITYDIDIAYSFKGRDLVRTAGAVSKDIITLKFGNLLERIQTLFTKKDPSDVYDALKETIEKSKLDSIFFFLLGDYSRYDKNIKHDHPLMHEIIKSISAFSEVAIHPSYTSSITPEKILIEKTRLENVVKKKITRSRQHYLRFNLPDTYNQLLFAGINEDYSMGFAGMPGFRAGICTPFYFYDLKNEVATKLKLFPMICMEGTFIYYLKYNPEQSLKIIIDLIEEVKKVDGLFISTWHNNTLSKYGRYKEWRHVHNEMIKKLSE